MPEGQTREPAHLRAAALVLTAGLLTVIVAAVVVGAVPHVIGPTEDHVGYSVFYDFRDTAWLPVRDLLSGGNPYDATTYLQRHPYAGEFTYLPAQITLFAPLAVLPLTAAAFAWLGIMVAGVIALAVLTLSVLRRGVAWEMVLLLAAAIVLLRPTGLMIEFGQTAILAIVGTSVALLRRRPDLLTAVGVAAAWLKPQFGIPLVIILLAFRLFRPVIWGTGIAVLVSAPALVWSVANAGGLGDFAASLPSAVEAALSSDETRPTNGYVTPDLGGLLSRLLGTGASTGILLIAAAVLVLGVGAWAAVRGLHALPPGPDLAAASALMTILLGLPHQNYELTMLVPALALCLRAIQVRTDPWITGAIAVASAAQVLILIPVSTVTRQDVALTLALLVIASAVAYRVMEGTPRRRLFVLCVAVAAVLTVRYVLGALLAPVISSGLLTAALLVLAWVALVTAQFMLPRRVSAAVDSTVPSSVSDLSALRAHP